MYVDPYTSLQECELRCTSIHSDRRNNMPNAHTSCGPRGQYTINENSLRNILEGFERW